MNTTRAITKADIGKRALFYADKYPSYLAMPHEGTVVEISKSGYVLICWANNPNALTWYPKDSHYIAEVLPKKKTIKQPEAL